MEFFEFQAKRSASPEFTTKDGSSNVRVVRDGERVIAKLVETKTGLNGPDYIVEDINGSTASLPSNIFFKITDPKNFSRKFLQFKTENHIVDC